MKYLTTKDVILLHNLLIDATGGSHGVRDYGLIDSAVSRPQPSFGSEDLYKTIFLKSAALVHSLLMNHAFVDGNKRTSMLSLLTFIELNGYEFIAEQKEIVNYALFIENSHPSLEEIATWIEAHAKKKRKK